MSWIVVDESIVRTVVNAFEAQGGATVVAFGGMVVHHVENHFHAGAMIRLDHGFEFVYLFAALPGTGVGVMRCEEADGVVAPVVAQSFFL